jgi:hypothetical protein
VTGITRDLELDAQVSRDNFRRIAELIVKKAPDFLIEYFERCAPSVHVHGHIMRIAPSRRQLRARLESMQNSPAEAQSGLRDTFVGDFLRKVSREASLDFLTFSSDASALTTAIKVALDDLVNSAGRTKAGRGKTQISNSLSADMFCALVVAEAWKFFYENYPDPKAERAAEACEAYWNAVGGTSAQSAGNRRFGRWKHYLREIRKGMHPDDRAELRRHLQESKRADTYLKSTG